LFTPAIVCSSSKDGMAAVAANSSVEAGRDRSMVAATPIRTTTADAASTERIKGSLRFPTLNVSVGLW
jgi:hypothetical protein